MTRREKPPLAGVTLRIYEDGSTEVVGNQGSLSKLEQQAFAQGTKKVLWGNKEYKKVNDYVELVGRGKVLRFIGYGVVKKR